MTAAAARLEELEHAPSSAFAPALFKLAKRYKCPELAALALCAKHGGAVDVRIEDVAKLADRSVPTLRRRFADGEGAHRPAIHAAGLVYRPGTGGVDGNTLSRFAVGAWRLRGRAGRHGNPATGAAPAHYRRPGQGWRGRPRRAPERPSEPLPLPAPTPRPPEAPNVRARAAQPAHGPNPAPLAPPPERLERGKLERRRNVTPVDKGSGRSSSGSGPGSHAWVRPPHHLNPERYSSPPSTRGVRGARVGTSDAGEGPEASGSMATAGEALRATLARFAGGSRREPGPGRGEPLRGGLGGGEGAGGLPLPSESASEALDAARGASALELATAGDADKDRPALDRLTAAGARVLRQHGDGPAERFRVRGKARRRKVWRDASSRAPWRARLQWAPVLEDKHLAEAQRQAKHLADAFRAEGALPNVQHGADPARWVPVLVTLAAAVGWEATARLLRAGLASGPSSSGRWEGWRRCLERDPRYALRRTFLEAARWGRRIPRGARWEDGFAWEPATPALAGDRERWLSGSGPPPGPDGDAPVRAAMRELMAAPPDSEPGFATRARDKDRELERRRLVGHRWTGAAELPEYHGSGLLPAPGETEVA